MAAKLPKEAPSPWDNHEGLQDRFVKHKGKRVAFNAGRHRMTGRVGEVDTRMHRVYIDVETGLEPGEHSFIISRMSGIAFLKD